jgi:hypothetical protein
VNAEDWKEFQRLDAEAIIPVEKQRWLIARLEAEAEESARYRKYWVQEQDQRASAETEIERLSNMPGLLRQLHREEEDRKAAEADAARLRIERDALEKWMQELRNLVLPGRLFRKFADLLLVHGDINRDAEMFSTLVLRNMADSADELLPSIDAAIAHPSTEAAVEGREEGTHGA